MSGYKLCALYQLMFSIPVLSMVWDHMHTDHTDSESVSVAMDTFEDVTLLDFMLVAYLVSQVCDCVGDLGLLLPLGRVTSVEHCYFPLLIWLPITAKGKLASVDSEMIHHILSSNLNKYKI